MNSGRATIWLNGDFTPLDGARISPLDRGFLYGDGLFETVRAEKGKILYLRMHLDRLHSSLSEFRIAIDPMPDWEQILNRLLRENDLTQGIAAIKLIVTRGISPSPGLPAPEKPTVCIMAGPYDPPPSRVYEEGWKLRVYREGYPPPLARFKSLNYLYSLTARQAALEAGCDEAIIVDQSGLVTETSAASLIARTDGRWWTPESRFQLPGTTIRVLCGIMENASARVEPRPARLDDFHAADTVWALNSLIGIMPVAQIDDQHVANPAPAEAGRLRDRLFART
ncbi:MAG: aminotransferase class IV [Syntrophobacteraceae bacterium]|jgi:branched-chain amino acid aminotransferase/para-aminobenzoate synthetase component 1